MTLSCWPASDCGPEANPLRLMKDRQTGLMKKFPEQSGNIIRDSGLANPIRQLSVRT